MDGEPTQKISEVGASKLEAASILAAITLLEMRLKEEQLRAAACRTGMAILKGEA
jgi:hypothetical protein